MGLVLDLIIYFFNLEQNQYMVRVYIHHKESLEIYIAADEYKLIIL